MEQSKSQLINIMVILGTLALVPGSTSPKQLC